MKPEWRFGRGWSESELKDRLRRAAALGVNFREKQADMTAERGWAHYFSEAVIAREAAGPATGPHFEKGRIAVGNYEFSDPGIVTAHFDPATPLLGRRMLLEIKVWGLHYLMAVVVGDVRSEQDEDRAIFGFRYDTLAGHIEAGSEWFTLVRRHDTGEIRFRIEAAWRAGQFPNWWSALGFRLLAPYYQRKWHHQAQRRLYHLVRADGASLLPDRRRLAHEGPSVVFMRGRPVDPGAA